VIARSCHLTVCGRPSVGSNGCETIILRLIDARKQLVITRVAGRLLGSHGCRCRSRGVWLGLYSINVFVVWVECVKALLVNVCNGTAKSAEIGSREMRVSNGQHADCAGLVLLFGENPQAVAYSAQPLCWTG